jgi:hypothetical protein
MELFCRRTGHWLDWVHPGRGGHLYWLPVWLFGVLWLVLGILFASKVLGQ